MRKLIILLLFFSLFIPAVPAQDCDTDATDIWTPADLDGIGSIIGPYQITYTTFEGILLTSFDPAGAYPDIFLPNVAGKDGRLYTELIMLMMAVDPDEAMPHYVYLSPPSPAIDPDEAMPHYGPLMILLVDPDEVMPYYVFVAPPIDIDEAMPHYGPLGLFAVQPDMNEALPHYEVVGLFSVQVDIDEVMPHYIIKGQFNTDVDIDEALPHYGPMLVIDPDEALPHYGPLSPMSLVLFKPSFYLKILDITTPSGYDVYMETVK